MTPLIVYQMVVSGWVLYTLINALADHLAFRRPVVTSGDTPLPSLSVLIPARNEAETIGPCLQSLLAQNYPGDVEILVLDDHSDDDTARIARETAGGDRRVKVLSGGDLIAGWKGKPNALRQLVPHATGDLLLLTDADCVFLPGALAASVRFRETVGADCLSLIPYLVCGSFWENVIVPLQYNVVFLTLPIRKIGASRNPAFAAANGAFLLLPRATYAALGGHEAVRGEMAEDIKFAQHVKRSGRRLVYGDGSRVYRVRMYDSLRGVWDGFSKNLFPAMDKNPLVLGIWATFLFTTQVAPFALVAFALLTGSRNPALWVSAVHAFVALAIRAGLSIRFGQSLPAALTHPVGWLVTLAIGFNSAYLVYSGKGHTWKGRTYATPPPRA